MDEVEKSEIDNDSMAAEAVAEQDDSVAVPEEDSTDGQSDDQSDIDGDVSVEDGLREDSRSECGADEQAAGVNGEEGSVSPDSPDCEGLGVGSDNEVVTDEAAGLENTDIDSAAEVHEEESAEAGGGAEEDGESEEDDDFELVGDDEFSLPLAQVVEALLFAADEPLSIEKIARAAGKRIRRDAIVAVIEELREMYRETERAFEIVEVAEKFQMLTRAEFARNVQALYGKRAIREEKEKKLSPAALDTLAIIAYKQPVTRAEVEAVRGVGCGQVMRQLMERGSIKPVGKKMDVIGYPILYGTTEAFLQEFGLASLDVLPMASELRRLTRVELPKPDVVEGEGDSSGEVHSKLEGAVVIESVEDDKATDEDSGLQESQENNDEIPEVRSETAEADDVREDD